MSDIFAGLQRLAITAGRLVKNGAEILDYRLGKDGDPVIELTKDPLQFDGRHEFCLMLNRFVDYCKISRKSFPEYLSVEREHYEKMRKSALSRKKVAVKEVVSFTFEGIPLVCFNPIRSEV